jgi:hypothetical protein
MNTETFEYLYIPVAAIYPVKQLMMKSISLGDSSISRQQAAEMANQLEDSMRRYPKSIHVFGAFQRGKLVSALVGEISIRFPGEWLMTYLITDTSRGMYWNYNNNGLEGCWEKAFTQFSKHGYTKVNWSLPTRWESTQKRTQRTSKLWSQFDIEILDRVPAGSMPEDEKLQWIFGSKPKSYDVTLKTAQRKSLNATH